MLVYLYWNTTTGDWRNKVFLQAAVLPITHPSLSKHWREHKNTDLNLPHPFFIHHRAHDGRSVVPFTPTPRHQQQSNRQMWGKQTHPKKDADRMPATDGVVVLLEIAVESDVVQRLDQIHSLLHARHPTGNATNE